MGFTISGKENIQDARLLTMRTYLKLEVAGLRSKINVYAMVKKEFGFKGSRVQVLEQLEDYISEKGILT